MKFNLSKLCTPAYIYLIFSIISIIILAFQNFKDLKVYCVGNYECDVDNSLLIFLFKIIYVLFWTFILNLLCVNGYEQLSGF